MRLAVAILFGLALSWANTAHAQTVDNSNNAQAEQPATDGDAANDSKTETFIPRVLTDEDTLVATDEQKKATAKATAEAKQAAMIAELDKQLLGSWGRISSRSAAGISEASIITGANQCLRTRKITKPEYADDAEKALPVENERRGNIVFYRTGEGIAAFGYGTPKGVFDFKNRETTEDENATGRVETWYNQRQRVAWIWNSEAQRSAVSGAYRAKCRLCSLHQPKNLRVNQIEYLHRCGRLPCEG